MKIKVTTIAFSQNKDLVKKAKYYFDDISFNSKGIRFTENQLITYLSNCTAAIIGLDIINEYVLSKLPNLKYIAKYGVGLDNIDLEACKKYNVSILWNGGVNKTSVAELTIGSVLSLCRNIYQTSNSLKKGVWDKKGGFELTNKSVGIIGLGHIGSEVIRILSVFDCNIYGNDIVDKVSFAKENSVKLVSKEEIFKKCDIISIHAPLTDYTRNLFTKKVFKKMKSNSILINTSRGGIINENDLKEALLNKIISAAAIDVYNEEPPKNLDLINLPNLICTPHIGGNSSEAVYNMGLSAIELLRKNI
jgi:phosphoglycerate dehydrogenase-like enzyme